MDGKTTRAGRPINQLTPARRLIEQNIRKLTEKALQNALLGDTAAISLLLDRVWPARSHVPTKLEPASIRAAVSKGLLSPEQGQNLKDFAEGYNDAG